MLDAKGTRRVITILPGAVAKLVGLNITGGAVVFRDRDYRYDWSDLDKDHSSQGGGLLVEKGGTADLEDCNIFHNSAIDVCFEPAFRNPQLVLIVCRAVPWQGSESGHFESSILNHSIPLM